MNLPPEAEGADAPLRSGWTLEEMREALRENGSVQDAAEALGMSGPNFQQQWRRRCEHAGVEQTPAEYLDSLGLRRGEMPRVFFRIGHDEYEQLEAEAAKEGIGANKLACQIIERWLKRRPKTK